MLMNCENIEKHTRKIQDIDYEKLAGLADALLVNINEAKQNNIVKLIEELPEGDHKKFSLAMIKAVEYQFKNGKQGG